MIASQPRRHICQAKNSIVTFDRIWHMNGIKTVVADGGRVVLPAALRKALGVSVGDEVMITLEDDGLRITTLERRSPARRRWSGVM